MTKVAPITDEELTRLERLYEEAREELHEEEESGETNSTIARCLFHDESWERFLSLLSRLRAAEARAEKAERERTEWREKWAVVDADIASVTKISHRASVATVARIVEESGTRQLRADLTAARADVERLRAFVRDSAYVVANVRTGDNRCGSCHALIHMCELADPKCRGAAARALLAETAPKGPHADT